MRREKGVFFCGLFLPYLAINTLFSRGGTLSVTQLLLPSFLLTFFHLPPPPCLPTCFPPGSRIPLLALHRADTASPHIPPQHTWGGREGGRELIANLWWNSLSLASAFPFSFSLRSSPLFLPLAFLLQGKQQQQTRATTREETEVDTAAAAATW